MNSLLQIPTTEPVGPMGLDRRAGDGGVVSTGTGRAAAPVASQIAAITAKAIAEGRHSDEFKSFCVGCEQWVDGIYYMTTDRKRLCRDCADKINEGPKSLQARRDRPSVFERMTS